jgi:hypothetical protein
MAARSACYACLALVIAGCGPTQTGRPVTQSPVFQPVPTAQPNFNGTAQPMRASVEEMSRTRGAGWILGGANNNVGTFYLHQPTMVRQGSVMQAWVINNLWEPDRNTRNFRYTSTLSRVEYDCIARRFRFFDVQWFSDRGASGENQSVGGVGEWGAIPPGSIAETNMNVACQRGPQARPALEPAGRPSQPPARLGPPKDPV